MSYEGHYNYRCECKEVDEGYSVYMEQPLSCRCGKPFTHVQSVDTTNSGKGVRGRWRRIWPSIKDTADQFRDAMARLADR